MCLRALHQWGHCPKDSLIVRVRHARRIPIRLRWVGASWPTGSTQLHLRNTLELLEERLGLQSNCRVRRDVSNLRRASTATTATRRSTPSAATLLKHFILRSIPIFVSVFFVINPRNRFVLFTFNCFGLLLLCAIDIYIIVLRSKVKTNRAYTFSVK